MSLSDFNVALKNLNISWNSNLAYAVGLLTADGNLSQDGRHLEITSRDIEQIETFKRCLNLKNKIGKKVSGYTRRKNCFRIQFGNIALYSWLLKIGLKPNKTKLLGKLEIPKEFFFDFLRGYFDGDGYAYSYWDHRWPNSFMFYTCFCSTSLTYLEWIREKLQQFINIKGVINRCTKEWILKYAKQESRILLQRMYHKQNLPCLERKEKKISAILKKDAEMLELVDRQR